MAQFLPFGIGSLFSSVAAATKGGGMGRVTKRKLMMGVGLFICVAVLWGRFRSGGSTDEVKPVDPASLQRKILESIALNKQLFSVDPPPTNHTEVKVIIPTHAAPAPARKQRVLLTSYMRAGSTFTGDLFQLSRDVFYFYEPLLYKNDDDEGPGKEATSGKLESRMSWNELFPPDPMAFTYKMLHCDVSSNDFRFLPGLRLSKSTKEFDKCRNRIDCSIGIRQKCKSRPVTVAKVLRLKMYEVDELLRYDPELKVIHLVRDPRGIAVSRENAKYFFNFLSFCTRINQDATDSAEMQKKYPGRLLTIRYEDLAASPVTVAKQMYDFAGITWTDDVEMLTLDMTSPSNTSFVEHTFETRRKHSTETASKWKDKLDFHTAFAIQARCNTAFKKYGYRNIRVESDMRDKKNKLFSDTFELK